MRALLKKMDCFQKKSDFQMDEKKKALLATIRLLRARRKGRETSLDVLRKLRGYEK